jgi:hypothetical protein
LALESTLTPALSRRTGRGSQSGVRYEQTQTALAASAGSERVR